MFSDAELLCDVRQIFRCAFKALGGGARDDFQVCHLGQSRQDFVLHAFGKERVVGIAAEIVERQYRDRFRRQFGASCAGGMPRPV